MINSINLLLPIIEQQNNYVASKVNNNTFDAMVLESALTSECIATHFNSNNSEASFINTNKFCSTKTSLKKEPNISTETIKHEAPSNNEFTASIWPYLEKASNALNVDPKILLAQIALETGWGKHVIKDSHNLFNIKAPKNASDVVTVKTKEFIKNNPIYINADFKKYASYEESINDYVSLIQNNPRYAKAKEVKSSEEYIYALQEAGYATDPSYAEKTLSIFTNIS